MLDWVMAPGALARTAALVEAAARRALVGGAVELVALELAPGRTVTFVEIDRARPRAPAAWPDLLVDWSEIHDAAPYPGEITPQLARALSELGLPSFAVAFDPARDAAAVAWFERGELVQLEHVGAATVAWTPDGGLGRPDMSGLAGGVASLARRLGADATVLDRIETQHAAGARAIVERALLRLCDRPPAVDDLAGRVATAAERLRLVV